MLAAARDERDQGQLENAYTAYRLALAEWLRAEWLRQPGKLNSSVTDPVVLATKLRSCGRLDAWTAAILKTTEQRPCPVRWTHVDVLAGVVEGLVLEGGVSR